MLCHGDRRATKAASSNTIYQLESGAAHHRRYLQSSQITSPTFEGVPGVAPLENYILNVKQISKSPCFTMGSRMALENHTEWIILRS